MAGAWKCRYTTPTIFTHASPTIHATSTAKGLRDAASPTRGPNGSHVASPPKSTPTPPIIADTVRACVALRRKTEQAIQPAAAPAINHRITLTQTPTASHRSLAIGETDNLAAALASKSDLEKLVARGANCICVLAIADKARRLEIQKDIIDGHAHLSGLLPPLIHLSAPASPEASTDG